MKHIFSFALAVSLSATVADAGSKDNFFNYKTKLVKGQIQMRGHFGKNWSVEEVRQNLMRDCKASGQTLAVFTLGDVHRKKGQGFVGVCN